MLLQWVQPQEQSFFYVWKPCAYGGRVCMLQLERSPNYALIMKLSNYDLNIF